MDKLRYKKQEEYQQYLSILTVLPDTQLGLLRTQHYVFFLLAMNLLEW
jgi:hypothetical protein